jgi:hypothetical protein
MSQPIGTAVAQQVQRVALEAPHQHAGPVVQAVGDGLERVVHRVGARCLEAVQAALVAHMAGRRLAIDLPAAAGRFVHHHRGQAVRHPGLRGGKPGRAGADDDRWTGHVDHSPAHRPARRPVRRR